MIKKNKTILSITYILAAVLLLSFASFLRFNYLTIFMWVRTTDHSAVKLFGGIANQWEMLKAITPHFTLLIIKGCFFGEVLTAASILFIYFFAIKSETGKIIFNKLAEGTAAHKAKLLWAGGILLVLLMVLAFFYQLAGRAVSTDEFAYDFQSQLLKSFKLYAPPPQYPEYFQCENIVINQEKWYSKYTVGFPLLLSLGKQISMHWIVNPLLSIGVLWFLYQLSLLLFDKRTANISVFFAVISPFFFYNGAAAFQPHISLAFALLGAAYFYFSALKSGKALHAVFTAGFFSLGALIRPVDAALWAAAFIPLSFYFLIAGKNKSKILISFLTMAAAGLIGVAVILLLNKIQTGEFFLFGFHQYQGQETWGFGSYSHNIYRALWNTLYSLFRIAVWGPLFFFELSIISLFSKQRKKQIFLWFIFLLFIGFFFGWYALGHYEYGPRYLFTGFMFLIPAAASGTVFIWDYIEKKGVPVKTALVSFFLVMTVSALTSVYPPFFSQIRQNVRNNAWVQLFNTSEEIQKNMGNPIAVFLANAPEYRVNSGTRNFYPSEDNKILYLMFLDPYKNIELTTNYYPNHTPFIAMYDPAANSFNIQHYPSLEEASPSLISQYFTFAGLVYRFGVEDQKNAEKCWIKAYEADSNNIGALMNLANMFLEEGYLNSSKRYLQLIKEINPNIPIIYHSLGMVAHYEGNDEEAINYYKRYINIADNENLKFKTLDRIYYFEEYGELPPLPPIEIKEE